MSRRGRVGPQIQPAPDRRYPYIPSGPYLDTENQPTPFLTKDIGKPLRESVEIWHKRIGEYIFANYEVDFPDPNEDFGVYLSAAIAKHLKFHEYMTQAKVPFDYEYHSRCTDACNKWYVSWLRIVDGNKDLSDAEKRYMIDLEEKLTNDMLQAYPWFCYMCYEANDMAVRLTLERLEAVGEMETTVDALQEQFFKLHAASKWLQFQIRTLETLPDHFWEQLILEERNRNEDWPGLIAYSHEVVDVANDMMEQIRDESDFISRGRTKYADWDPLGFEQSEERGGDVIGRDESMEITDD